MALFGTKSKDTDDISIIIENERSIQSKLKQRQVEIEDARQRFEQCELAERKAAATSANEADPSYLQASIARNKAESRLRWLQAAFQGEEQQLAELQAKRLNVGKQEHLTRMGKLCDERAATAVKLDRILKEYVGAVLALYLSSSKLAAASPIPVDAGAVTSPTELHRLIQLELARTNPDEMRRSGSSIPGEHVHALLNKAQLKPLVREMEEANSYLLRKLEETADTRFVAPEQDQSSATVQEKPSTPTKSAVEIMATMPKQKLKVG